VAGLGGLRGRHGAQPLQHLLELLLQDSKVGDLFSQSVQVFGHQLLQRWAHHPGWPTTEVSGERLELAQRESKRPGATDEQGPMDVAPPILPVPRGVASGSRQHSHLFIVANSFRCQAADRRELANGQCSLRSRPSLLG
jgi:hypothetical protein